MTLLLLRGETLRARSRNECVEASTNACFECGCADDDTTADIGGYILLCSLRLVLNSEVFRNDDMGSVRVRDRRLSLCE